MILDVIDVKQNHSKGGKSDLYVCCVDGCAKPTPISCPVRELESPRDKKPSLPKVTSYQV
jgi:hypothetical protein